MSGLARPRDAEYYSSADSASGSDDERARGRPARSKEEALYGVFADDDDEPRARRGLGGKGKQGRGRPNYAAGQAFVASSSSVAGPSGSKRSAPSSSSGSSRSRSSSSSSSRSLSPASRLAREPATAQEELETRPAFGALPPTAAEAEARRQADSKEGFEPAGFSASRGDAGRGGIGTRGGIGARAGLGAGEPQSRGGIGSSAAAAAPRGGIGSSAVAAAPRGGIGSAAAPARGGIGARAPDDMDVDEDDDEPAPRVDPALASAGVPSSFGASTAFQPKPKPKPSFLHAAPPKPIAPGHGGAFASMMMSRMGWSGGGLGKEGEGIINPIEVQQRPERSGIAFGGFREKTRQAKEEARRRGEVVSEDEEAPKERRRGRERKERKEPSEIKVQAWQRAERKARKPKVEHRTYEQILEEAGAAPAGAADMGPILDATGAKVVEVSSLSHALAMQGVPSADTTQLPELRHNLRLICSNNASLLKGLAQEGTRILERRRWLVRERDEAERRRIKISSDAQSLREALALVRELERVAADARGMDAFDDVVGKMEQSAQDAEQFGLDEALVGAIAATFKREMQDWKPLEDPKRLTKQLRRWRRVLRIEGAEEQQRGFDAYGNERKAPSSSDAARSMRPYEVLLWTLWMPPVRSALNNTWRPASSSGHTSAPAIALLEAWTPLLPRFIYDNLLDQLLLPKLRAAVGEWEARSSRTPLSGIVFPWLPVLGDRMTEVMEDARRRLRSSLKSWRASDGVPSDLARWRDVYAAKDWDAMLLSLVLPKLAAHLKALRINPAAQDLAPFVAVMQWRTLLRPLNFSRLFEADFFPAWLSTLHLWLTQPGVDFDEVAQWYSFWRAQFPAEVAALAGVKQGFARGLDLVNQAMEAPDAATRAHLPKPDTTPLSRAAFAAASAPAPPPAAQTGAAGAPQAEAISFRRIVEEAAAAADLLVLPLDKAHPSNGLPLFRIAQGMDKGGVVFYLDDDVVWSRTAAGGEWEPMALEELVKKAKR